MDWCQRQHHTTTTGRYLIKTHSAVPKSPNFSNPKHIIKLYTQKETQSLNKTLRDSVTSKRQIKRETKRKIKEKRQYIEREEDPAATSGGGGVYRLKERDRNLSKLPPAVEVWEWWLLVIVMEIQQQRKIWWKRVFCFLNFG